MCHAYRIEIRSDWPFAVSRVFQQPIAVQHRSRLKIPFRVSPITRPRRADSRCVCNAVQVYFSERFFFFIRGTFAAIMWITRVVYVKRVHCMRRDPPSVVFQTGFTRTAFIKHRLTWQSGGGGGGGSVTGTAVVFLGIYVHNIMHISFIHVVYKLSRNIKHYIIIIISCLVTLCLPYRETLYTYNMYVICWYSFNT